MKKEYKNEASKLFDRCSKNENIMLIIYIFNILFMVLVTLDFKYEIIIAILNYLIIIINIIYIAISGYNDIILKNIAEKELRKTMISDSFDIDITTTKKEGYYSNSVKPSIERMGMNSFESTLYTNKITEKLIFKKLIKLLLIVIVWIMIAKETNIEIMVIATQILFSADVMLDFIKTIYYHISVNELFNDFYKIYVTEGYKNKHVPLIIQYVIEYECLKNYCHITLPNAIFDKEEEKLKEKWNQISKSIKVSSKI